MQVTELKNEGIDFQIKVTIPSNVITDEVQKELTDISKKAKIAGFRVGKVPINMINNKYGASIGNDVVQQQVNNSIKHIIEDRNLNIITSPTIEDFKSEEGKDLEFTLKFELIPTFTLPQFNQISIEKPILKIQDQDIKSRYNELIKAATLYSKETAEKASNNDQVTIDAVGYIDDKAFTGGKLDQYKLVLGSKNFIEGFEEQLIGHKVGDQVTVNVTFPTEYHKKELAGKAAKFETKILAVHTPEVPEINDEFAKKFNCENVEKLQEHITKAIEHEYAESIQALMKMHLFDQLENILEFEVPNSLLEKEYSILKNQLNTNDDEEPILKASSPEELDQYYKKLAARRVRIGLMISEYVKAKNLQVNQDDIKNAILNHASGYPGHEHEIIEIYRKNSDLIEKLKSSILEEKATYEIFNNEVKLIEKPYTIKEFEKYLEKENKIKKVIS